MRLRGWMSITATAAALFAGGRVGRAPPPLVAPHEHPRRFLGAPPVRLREGGYRLVPDLLGGRQTLERRPRRILQPLLPAQLLGHLRVHAETVAGLRGRPWPPSVTLPMPAPRSSASAHRRPATPGARSRASPVWPRPDARHSGIKHRRPGHW